ncbi:MAG TPA: alcohol dehydrogenase, partial [Candidatus Aveggerthella excrementigallinarum]|nr:alcohol dehydrogenase [Candidatus Aveggerthella excrementigallinarum]
LVIDVENLGAYQEGSILKRGDRRIGVFSVAFNEPLPRVQAKVDALRAARVDFVVAITPDRQFVESATGIDIALSMTDEGSSFLGGTVNGTFYVDSPLVGQVGAVLVSPHNVVSAKDVTEL